MRYHFHNRFVLRLVQTLVVIWGWLLVVAFGHVLIAVILTLILALTELVLMEPGPP